MNLIDKFIEIPELEPDCKWCEEMVIGGVSVSYHFMCEGSFCNEVMEHQEESFLEDSVWFNWYCIKARFRGFKVKVDRIIVELGKLKN